MKKITILAAILTSLSFQANADTLKLTQVMYQEASPGVGVSPYRILVNQDFLRFDGGKDHEGYLLFDRKKKQVTSVNHEDQSRFIVKPTTKGVYENTKIVVKVVPSTLKNAPNIQGVTAKLYDITANENLCRQVLSLKGLLPEVTKAWAEFEEIMQAQNQLTLSRTPKDMQTDCFLTNNISHASLFLKEGLPYSIKSKDGNLRILQSYSVVEKPAVLMSTPSKYSEFTM